MDVNSIDASIGLAFSLELFKAYKATGTLQAPLKNVPGVSKNSIAILQLIDGVVKICSIQEKKGQLYPIALDMIMRLDDERGPFEWKFTQRAPTTNTGPITPNPALNVASFSPVTPIPSGPGPMNTPRPSSGLPQDAVPKIIARLNWIRLRAWPYEQRQIVYLVWQLIDGQRSIQDIQAMLHGNLSRSTVEEVLRLLGGMQVITMK